MTQSRKQQAIFPDLPRDNKMVDKDGYVTSPWQLYFQQLTMALQTNYKPEGIVVPPLSAANIADLGNVDGAIGNILYDSTNNLFKGIVLVTLGPPVVTITKTFTLT
jgi:hypothetical protein